MKKGAFILTLLILFPFLVYSKYILNDHWNISKEKNEKWIGISLNTSLKKQSIEVKKGETISYKYDFSKNKIEYLIKNGEDIGIYIGKIEGNTELYFNDKLLLLNKYATRIIFCRLKIDSIKEHNTILLKVKKEYNFSNCSLNNSKPYIDFYSNILNHYYCVYLILIITGVITMIIGIYYLLFYSRKLGNHEYLIFFFMCLTVSVYTILKSELKFTLIDMGISWFLIKKVVFISLYSLPFLGVLFFLKIYKLEKKLFQNIRNITGGITLLLVATVLVSNYEIMNRSLPLYHLFATVCLFGYFYFSFRALHKNKDIIFIIAGLILLLLFSLIDIVSVLYFWKEFDKFPFFSIGYSLYLMTAGLFLSKMFLNINLKLKELTEFQDQQVKDRTRELYEEKEANKAYFEIFAHEMKTPLTVITHEIDEIKKKESFEKRLLSVEMNINKMSNHIESYLEAEKIDLSKLYVHDKIINLSDFLLETVTLNKERLKSKKGILLVKDIAPSLHIKADYKAVEYIVNNLLDNAMKYTKEGSIKLALKIINKEQMEFIIEDTGRGIPDNEIDHIFNRYFRGEAVRGTDLHGVGMGLFIVKRTLYSLKSSIKVESKVNEFTRFILTLPLHNLVLGDMVYKGQKCKLDIPDMDSIEDTKEYDREKETLFIVEDNREVLRLLRNNFIETYNIYTALNGKEALEKLNIIPEPDIILSDYMMPELDGKGLLEEVQKKYSGVPFIFLTAKNNEEERFKMLSQKAVDYISKPFHIGELEKKIETLIHLDKQRIEKADKRFEALTLEEVKAKVLKGAKVFGLSERECDLLAHLLFGISSEEIGRKFSAKVSTIYSHRKNIIDKLGLDKYDSLQIAILLGL